MKVRKNYWFLASGVLVVTGAVLFSEKRVEAQYASPVKVMNTTSAPAISSNMDDPGRIPYNSEQIANANGESFTLTYAVVPANHRLVVTQITSNLQLTNNDPIGMDITAESNAVFGPSFFLPQTANAFNGTFYSKVTQPVLVYFDGGQTPRVGVLDYNGSGFNGQAVVSLTGYMLDCSAAPCAAIAH
jgi:hypothetical protein